MADASDYLENKVLDHVLGVASYTQPTLYVALFTTMPNADTGTGGTELSTLTGYNRQAVTFSAASSGTASNSNTLTYGPNTTTNWGTVVGAGVYDASSAGNLLFSHVFTDGSIACTVGDRIFIDPTKITVSLD